MQIKWEQKKLNYINHELSTTELTLQLLTNETIKYRSILRKLRDDKNLNEKLKYDPDLIHKAYYAVKVSDENINKCDRYIHDLCVSRTRTITYIKKINRDRYRKNLQQFLIN